MTLARRVMRAMTADSVVLATALSELDASWGVAVAPIADGWAVLCGPGMFVNRLEGAGIDAALSADHLEEFERLAQRVGVPAAVALPEFAEPGNLALLSARGYRPDSAVSVSVMPVDARELAEQDEQLGFVLEAGCNRRRTGTVATRRCDRLGS